MNRTIVLAGGADGSCYIWDEVALQPYLFRCVKTKAFTHVLHQRKPVCVFDIWPCKVHSSSDGQLCARMHFTRPYVEYANGLALEQNMCECFCFYTTKKALWPCKVHSSKVMGSCVCACARTHTHVCVDVCV